MELTSGRPISFQMDLYQPLYVSRPTVVPELFASLQPRTYDGTMEGDPTVAQGRGEKDKSVGGGTPDIQGEVPKITNLRKKPRLSFEAGDRQIAPIISPNTGPTHTIQRLTA